MSVARLFANNVEALRDQRDRGRHWIRILIFAGLVVVAWVWASALTNLRYTYLLGIAGAAGFLWVVFVRRKLGTALGLVAMTAVVLDAELGGHWEVGGYQVGMTDAVLVVLLVGCLAAKATAWRRVQAGASGGTSTRELIHRILLGGFLLLFLLALLSSSTAQEAVDWWWTVGLRPALLFLAAAAVVRMEGADHLVWALLAFGVFVAVNENMKIFVHAPLVPPRVQLGFAQQVAGEAFREKLGLVTVAFVPILTWPSWAGALAACLVPFSLGLAIFERGITRRLAGTLAAGALVVPLLAYTDRASWLGAFTAAAIVAGFAARSGALRPLSVALVLPVAVAILVVLSGTVAVDALPTVADIGRSDRWALWANTLQTIPHTPWLRGIGFVAGAFESYTSAHGQVAYRCRECLVAGQYSQPHNSYLHLIIAAGVPAFVCFFLLLVLVLKNAVRALLRCGLHERREQALLAVLSSWCGLCIMAGFNRLLWYGPLSAVFWLLMGATEGLTRLSVEPQVAEQDGPRVG